jgi:hypothetical protein
MAEKKNKTSPVWVMILVVLASPLIFVFKRMDIYGESIDLIISKYGLFYLFTVVVGLAIIIWKYVINRKPR